MSEKPTNTIDYLYSLGSLGIKPGLERIHRLCTLLQDPHRETPCIIVGGTNGKGSTVAFLTSILGHAGLRTAAYTSPHIHKFNERISIAGEQISDADIERIANKIKNNLDGYNLGKSNDEKLSPTFFEFTTALAFEYFKQRKPDIAVMEVGMGGLWDAVNIAEPLLSIITDISVDHTDFMGDSLEAIAKEKAGIIRAERIVITAVTEGVPAQIVKEEVNRKNATAMILGKDFLINKSQEGKFNYRSKCEEFKGLTISLSGDHQLRNASLALSAALCLRKQHDFAVPDKAVFDGLESAYIPCRLELIRREKTFDTILDAAHNHQAAKTVAYHMSQRTEKRNLTVMLGIMRNKEYEKMADELSNISDRIVLVRPKMERAWSEEQMYGVRQKAPDKYRIIPDIPKALEELNATLTEKDTLLITGSIFTVSQARALLKI